MTDLNFKKINWKTFTIARRSNLLDLLLAVLIVEVIVKGGGVDVRKRLMHRWNDVRQSR
jgi:hypothetical protein